MRYTVRDEENEIVFESDSGRKVIVFLNRRLKEDDFYTVHDATPKVTVTAFRGRGTLIIGPREHDLENLGAEVDVDVVQGIPLTHARTFTRTANIQARRMNTAQSALQRAATSLGTPIEAELIEIVEEPAL